MTRTPGRRVWEDGTRQWFSTPSLIRWMGGRIEPAEPEPPPAHSIGRVGEDVMGRSGQLVRPCWLDAGGVAGGEQLVARLVVRLVRASFFGQMCTHLYIVFSTFLVDFVFQMTPNPQKMGGDRKKRKKT